MYNIRLLPKLSVKTFLVWLCKLLQILNFFKLKIKIAVIVVTSIIMAHRIVWWVGILMNMFKVKRLDS